MGLFKTLPARLRRARLADVVFAVATIQAAIGLIAVGFQIGQPPQAHIDAHLLASGRLRTAEPAPTTTATVAPAETTTVVPAPVAPTTPALRGALPVGKGMW